MKKKRRKARGADFPGETALTKGPKQSVMGDAEQKGHLMLTSSWH